MEKSQTVVKTGLNDPEISARYAHVLVPTDLLPGVEARARVQAAKFCELVRRHLDGDSAALAELGVAVRAAAAEMLQHDAEPGVMLERLDDGRRLVLNTFDRGDLPPGELSGLDNRLAAVQVTARRAIVEAIATDEATMDVAVARVLGPDASARDSDDLMQAAAESFRELVGGDTARLWLDRGAEVLELAASAGRSVVERRVFASGANGRLAQFLHSAGPSRHGRPESRVLEAWRDVIPDVEEPVATLATPLRLADRPFGILYAVRYADGPHPEPFSTADERAARLLSARIEPALAWSLQARTAQRAGEATRDVLRLTTHEMRRPLAVLRGYVDMLSSAGPDDAPVFCERIARAAERLSAMLSEITDTAMVEDPLRPLHLGEHRLGAIIERVTAAAGDEAEQCGCQLEVRVADADATVRCDSHHIEHAIANLLSNAFSHAGSGARVRLRAGQRGQRFWRISVRDNGPGFPADDAERLFDKFFRAAPAGPGTTGSGLGLYYVRTVAERHGGSATAINVPGGGAEFTVTLPMAPGGMPWAS